MQKNKIPTFWIAVLSALLVIFALGACAPAQDASRSRSEYRSAQGATLAAQGYASEADLLQGIMPADELRVEEYLNYYDQKFPSPQSPDALRLDASLGNTYVPDGGGEAWLQVGLQAAEPSFENRKPLNLVLVLDKSGSMAEQDKMSYLKQSLQILVDELQPEDRLGIVTYDSQATVALPSQPVGEKSKAKATIDRLAPGSSTNLHGGLMLGYQEAMKHFSAEASNQVILFTDGNANQGVTDPDQIARDSQAYNDEGIHLSVIGLGLDLNDALLSKLAEQGKGNYHFISDPKEMERVFREELDSMVQTVATQIWLTLELARGMQVQRVYGYDYKLESDTMRVQFDDAGAGGNQVLMVKLVVPAGEGEELTLARAILEYTDAASQEQLTQEALLTFSHGAPEPYDALVSPQVRRNATILRMAETLQQVSYLCNERRYASALTLVKNIKADVWQIATQEGDAQMQEDVKLLENYETTLSKLIEVSTAPPQPAYEERPQPTGGCISPYLVLGAGLLVVLFWRRRAV